MTRRRVLVLGGTAQARVLAAALAEDRTLTVTSSLAGRVSRPQLPPGRSRVGGFGGVEGLAQWLVTERVDLLVDATHPFAATISAAAAVAAHRTGVPLLTLRRPEWTPVAGDRWLDVDSLAAAAVVLPTLGSRVFLTTGRQGLAEFAHLHELWFLVRTIDPPGPPLPSSMHLLLDRGPYTEDSELALMRRHHVDVLVTKNSGGAATVAKLGAARCLGLPVVLVRRPPAPVGVSTVDTVEAVVRWLAGPDVAQPG